MRTGAYDPWQDAESRADLDVVIDPDLPARRGDAWWVPMLRAIAIRADLHPTHERCVLAHELVHVDDDDRQLAGRGPDGTRLGRRQEQRADRTAARRLIRIRDLVAAVTTHPTDPAAVAHELDVTQHMLRVRLEHLQRAESALLAAAILEADAAA
ncbi:ImmA/IrrE family metallo-endopeptidase [Klenkia sp. LSe6-5]|uniref:ImmA/IrrE family metallo-endopeptidase n=1 Tax=Klenkia sesuvii TaxID=3103137 RepID=A0ABU8DYX7_9ACTN